MRNELPNRSPKNNDVIIIEIIFLSKSRFWEIINKNIFQIIKHISKKNNMYEGTGLIKVGGGLNRNQYAPKRANSSGTNKINEINIGIDAKVIALRMSL